MRIKINGEDLPHMDFPACNDGVNSKDWMEDLCDELDSEHAFWEDIIKMVEDLI